MIKKIDIKKFGLYNGYIWNNAIGKETSFKRLNIIYGRNYSGKTLLARIFRCIEKGELHKHYYDGDFTIISYDGNTIAQNNLTEFQNENQIRVYNTDFVKENLSWLHNEDGSIKPFTILGSKNVELDTKIKAIEEKLGNVEEKKGLLFENFENENKYNEKHKKLTEKRNGLESKLKSKANDKIKVDSNLFLPTTAKKTYNINDIQGDIETVQDDLESYIFNKNQVEEKKKLLSEKSQPSIEKVAETKPNFEKCYPQAKELLSRQIKPNKPITDLINDSLLQEWVRQGIDKHKGKREKCGFCGGVLPPDLWEKLDAHFSKESEDLRKEIETQIQSLEKAKQNLYDFLKLKKDSFYSSFYLKFDELFKSWTDLTKDYSSNLDKLTKELKSREQDIFKARTLTEINDVSENLLALIKEFNLLIDENNLKTNTLAKDQQKNRYDLRLSEVAQFVKDIDFKKKREEIEKLEKETVTLEQEKNSKQSEINILNENKRALEAEAKDESKGAELVNQHLSNFFGHDELKLVAEGETPNMKFKITRENIDANNLSEGECSLISFCYFIARMEDEMKDEFNNSKLIIYIDDPVSSLDSNHIFFMFSMIESVIAKPKKYGQLFISTHNLDFLKYLKRLTTPGGKENINYFLTEKRHKQNDKRCFLYTMPSHIKDYVTEFNYLFNEIYKVYKEVKGDRKTMLENTYNQFYNLPNNLRKFLECYLFYKFPNNDSPLNNLGKLFDDNIPSLINRVIHEYSHLTYIDRGWKPIDVDEAEDCAKIIIEKIREKDPDQYAALLESIKQKPETENNVNGK